MEAEPLARRVARRVARMKLRWGWPGDLVAPLDYDHRDIRIGISSSIEQDTRIHSCKKEPETVSWIERELTEEAVFYDVGANVGTYTLIAAAYWGQSVRVVAIEPSAINFSRLLMNLKINRCAERVIPLPVALARRTGLESFHYANLEAGGALHTLGSPSDLSARGLRPALSVPTLAFDLDTLIQQFHLPEPTHLKVDVDGQELDVLEGAQRVLPGVRGLLVELEEGKGDSQVRRFLSERGFRETASYPYRYGHLQPEYRRVANVIFQRASQVVPCP